MLYSQEDVSDIENAYDAYISETEENMQCRENKITLSYVLNERRKNEGFR